MKKSLFGISLLTITALYCLLSAVIILITILTGSPVIYGIIISTIIIIVQFLVSPFITDIVMKLFYKAKFDNEIPEYLKNFINQVLDILMMVHLMHSLMDIQKMTQELLLQEEF